MSFPPFTITPQILLHLLAIQEVLGELKAVSLLKPSLKLRRETKIKTIRHSLAIEGNDLDPSVITAIIDNKRVLGPTQQIQEIKNAVTVYHDLAKINPLKSKELLRVHGLLMAGLVSSAGKWREKNVGILKGKKISHVAPQARRVPELMANLFEFLNKDKETPLLVRACVFHYELEFIHPFEDGNGRIGRLWQQLILMRHSPVFEFLSVESLIHEEQKRYYEALEKSDRAGDSTAFIDFSLRLILQSLEEFRDTFRPKPLSANDRLELAQGHFLEQDFSRRDYLSLHKQISTATASRDLAHGVELGRLHMKGEKALTLYRFKASK